MIDVDEAQGIVLARSRPLPMAEVALSEAHFRTLAAPVVCDVDYPPFDRSLMDGYAVKANDTMTVPVTLRVVGQVAAGTQADRELMSGEAMQINTGAPIPRGADAVVRVESTEPPTAGSVVVKESVQQGRFVTSRATYARAGQTVLHVGSVLTPVNIGVAATAGAARVRVFLQPSVAILVTGDELVDITDRPGGATIRNSNQYILESLIKAFHCRPVVLGVARDDRDLLRRKIAIGLEQDVLCITGGVSMGAFDFVPDVLKELGMEFHVERMAIKPGRPTIFATTPAGKLVFALPGNPVSALVGFHLLVVPALTALQGRPIRPPLVRALLRGELSATGDRRTFRPARIGLTANGEYEARVLSWQGSGDIIGMAHANALIVQPPRSPAGRDGSPVNVLLLDTA